MKSASLLKIFAMKYEVSGNYMNWKISRKIGLVVTPISKKLADLKKVIEKMLNLIGPIGVSSLIYSILKSYIVMNTRRKYSISKNLLGNRNT